MTTLENSGYLYSPITTDNIWANQSPLNMTQVRKEEISAGDARNALPGASSAVLSENKQQGSAKAAPKQQTRQEFIMGQEIQKTALLAVVLAAAFFWSRS